VCVFLGFQVVGGENSGTIISSITAGGPADVNGCLRPGRPVLCDALPPIQPVYDACLGTCCDDSEQRQHVSHRCNVDAGDRLISVNDVNLNGLSHTTTIDILQNAPDDVTLVVLQPKESLNKGETILCLRRSRRRRYRCLLYFVHACRLCIFLFLQNLPQAMFPIKPILH